MALVGLVVSSLVVGAEGSLVGVGAGSSPHAARSATAKVPARSDGAKRRVVVVSTGGDVTAAWPGRTLPGMSDLDRAQRVVVLGSVNVDVVTRVERLPRSGETVIAHEVKRRAGGKGANQAVAAVGRGPEVVLVGCVGDDAHGQASLAHLASRGVDVSHVRVIAGLPTGQAHVTVAANGGNQIVVVPGANAEVSSAEVATALSLIGPGDVLLLQLEIPVEAVAVAADRAATAGARVVLNAAPFRSLPGGLVAVADPVIVNEGEALALADSALVPSSLLVTFGANGLAWDGVHYQAVPVEDVVDTTGAGDALCGALAAALASGAEREAAVRQALIAGAKAVGHDGAQRDALL